jgi:hypothetical protein
MKSGITTIILILMTVVFIGAQTAGSANLDSAVSALSSYYQAINDGDYRKAYDYWETPTEDFDDFSDGYEDTENVRLLIEPPERVVGAAGSLFVEIPTVLIATHKDGLKQTFSGCYTLRKSNLRKTDVWQIYRAAISPADADADTAELLAKGCGENTVPPVENLPAQVPGIIGFGADSLADAVKIPAGIETGKEFEVTITTSGNGCFSKGETGVVMSDTGADIFVYDMTTAVRPGIACTMILKQMTHTVTLKFSKRGEAVIRVWGRQQTGERPSGEPLVIERRVMVK